MTLGDEQFASSLSFVKTSGAFVGTVSPNDEPSFYDLTGAWRHDRGGIVRRRERRISVRHAE